MDEKLQTQIEQSVDRYFEFLDWYKQSDYSTIPLSHLLLPYPTQGVRTPGSYSGFFKGSKREWNNINK